MCTVYSCSRSTLAILNILYMLVALIMIGVAVYALGAARVTRVPVVGGIIACGVFLLIISIIGLIGAIKQYQVLVLVYAIILFILFVLQFAIAVACLSINKEQQHSFLKKEWETADLWAKWDVQYNLNCCGFDLMTMNSTDKMGHPSCQDVACCKGVDFCCTAKATEDCPCDSCWDKIEPNIGTALRAAGGVGLFFSFTEMIGVWLAFRFRNMKDPMANPNAFL